MKTRNLKQEYQCQVQELDIARMEEVLGYVFKDKNRLIRALTHSSISDINNEAMEFRGDKILGFLMSEIIEQKTPDYTPRERTEIFCAMTNNKLMREKIAVEWNLSDHIISPPTTHLTGKPISDCVEAVICAVYDDGDMQEAANFIVKHWKKHLNAALEENKPQSTLSDYFNAKSLGEPHYKQEKGHKASKGLNFNVFVPAHDGMDSGVKVTGSGTSPRRAKNHAALLALKALGITPPPPKPESPKA